MSDTVFADYPRDVADVIASVDGARPRTQQTEVGVSDVAGCRRKAAYKRHAVPPTNDTVPHPAAMLGTWLHESLLPHLAGRWGGEVEVGVHVDGVPGSADIVVGDTVIDLKTAGDWTWRAVTRLGEPTHAHRLQTHGYAHGLREAGYPIAWIVVVYLHRATGEAQSFTEPVDDDLVTEWLDRWHAIRDSTDPTDLPRDEHGPGLSVVCDGCPWMTACWPHAQATVVEEGGDPAVADLLASYDAANAREKAAKDDKAFARAALADTPAGTYGRYRLTWARGREVLDQKAIKGLLLDAGITDLPMTTSAPSIRVTPAKG